MTDPGQLLAEAEGKNCKCGHRKAKHAFLRGRCTILGCECVQYENAAKFKLLDKALSLDEQLAVALADNSRLRNQLLGMMRGEGLPNSELELRKEVEELRSGLLQIISDPTSTRASVQSIARRLLKL